MTVHVTASMLVAYKHFHNAGLHEKGAAAAIGNFVQESGENLDTTMFRAHPDPSGGVAQELKSGGIAEWLGDRKMACIAFSRAKEANQSLPPDSLLNDLETQCDFCLHELRMDVRYGSLLEQLTTETLDQFGNPRSIATLTANFMEIYERPAAATAGLRNRIDHAEAVYSRAQMIKGAPPAPQPGPVVPIPPTPAPMPPAPPPAVPAGPPISAHIAARQVAIEDNLHAVRAAVVAERDAYIAETDKLLAKIDRTIADFGEPIAVPGVKLITGPAPSLHPSAGPPAITPTKGIQGMLGKSWITSVFGVGSIAGAFATLAIDLINKDMSHLGADLGLILSALSAGGIGLAAKDKSVTGGTISAVTGEQLARPVSLVDAQPPSAMVR